MGLSVGDDQVIDHLFCLALGRALAPHFKRSQAGNLSRMVVFEVLLGTLTT